MIQSYGFEQHDESGNVIVGKLHKALYSLKQAPRAWFEWSKYFLISQLHFAASLTDDCSFFKSTSFGTVYMIVYVDDIVITGSDSSEIE